MLLRTMFNALVVFTVFSLVISLWHMQTYTHGIHNFGTYKRSADNIHWSPLDTTKEPFLVLNRSSQEISLEKRNIKLIDISVKRANCTAKFHGNNIPQKSMRFRRARRRNPLPPIRNEINCTDFILQRKYIMNPVSEEEAEFPIAFGIMLYKDPRMAERLLRAVYRPQNVYCIHVDSKANEAVFSFMRNVASCFDNVIILTNRLSVVWGEYSVLAQEIKCMEELWIFKQWKYYINLTGQEFPLRTNLELVKILKAFKGGNNVHSSIARMKAFYMPRVQYVHNGSQMTRERKAPPPINITLAKGSVHVVLVRSSVDFILHDKRALAFRDWLNDTSVPDETFFSSLNVSPQLGMPGAYTGSLESDPNPRNWVVNNTFISRFKSWSDHGLPCDYFHNAICIIGVRELQQLHTAPQMFVNKLHSDYQPLAYDCLEESIFTRVNHELSGHSTFNTSLYESLDFVKHHL